MKTKNVLTALFILLLASTTFSQSGSYLVSLDFEIQPIITDFKCVEVIDKRFIKENIGFVKKGLNNRYLEAKLITDFESVLKHRTNKLIRSSKNAKEIVFIFHEFNISERTTAFSEKGICRIEIEFAKKVGSDYYSLGSYFSEEESKGIGDATKKHANRILWALRNCIRDFQKSNWKTKKGEKIDLNEEVVFYNYNEIPIKGLYSSFNKLASNKPLPYFDISFKPQSKESKVRRYNYGVINNKDRDKKVMFICDGSSIYMHASRYCYKDHFIKAKHLGRYTYFEDRFSGDALAFFAFGVVGVMASTNLKPFVLDTATGNVILLTDGIIAKLSKEYPLILSNYYKSKRDIEAREKVILQLNEQFRE